MEYGCLWTRVHTKSVLSLTWHILRVLGQFLSADEHREGVPTIVGLVYLPDFHCVIHQIVVDDLCVCVCVCVCVWGGGGGGGGEVCSM